MLKKIIAVSMISTLLPFSLWGMMLYETPEFQTYTMDGKLVDQDVVVPKGRHTLVVFWATWCHVCAQELPRVVKLYEKIKGKKNIEFVGINVGINEEENRVKKFVKAWKLNFPIYYDKKNQAVRAFRVRYTPKIVLIDNKGDFMSMENIFNDKEIEEYIDALPNI